MRNLTVTALLAGALCVSACGQKSEHAADSKPTDATSDKASSAKAHSGMVLPVTTSSEEARGHYMKGWHAFEMARNTVANEHFAKAVKADPKFAAGHAMMAVTATSTEGFVSAVGKAGRHAAGASRGEQLWIEALQAALDSDGAGQLAKLKEITKLHPDSPRAWMFYGQTAAGQNKTADAIAALKKSVAIDPNFAAGHMALGNTYMFNEPKDLAMAEKHIKMAVKIAPNEPNPYDLLGDVHRSQGNLKGAYDDYTKAAKLAPDFGSPLQQRGHVNSFLGNFDEARADYSKAAELETARGSNAGPFFMVFRAYVSLHEGNPEAAIAELNALASKEDSLDVKINALTNVAQIATHYGNAEAARSAITAVSALMREQAADVGTAQFSDAQEATISYMEGMLAARMGDATGAAARADEFKGHVASSTNPRKMERMHEILGNAAFYQGDYASAVEHLGDADHLNNMAVKYQLAVANANAGNTDAANKLFKELAVWNFNGPGYAMNRKDILERVAAM